MPTLLLEHVVGHVPLSINLRDPALPNPGLLGKSVNRNRTLGMEDLQASLSEGFINTSPHRLELHWVGSTGSELVAELESGSTHNEGTFTGHSFRVMTTDGDLVGEHTVEDLNVYDCGTSSRALRRIAEMHTLPLNVAVGTLDLMHNRSGPVAMLEPATLVTTSCSGSADRHVVEVGASGVSSLLSF